MRTDGRTGDSIAFYSIKACPHCRRKVRLSPNSATVAVVSLLRDKLYNNRINNNLT